MKKIFKHFPTEDCICPVCGTSEDKECVLIPIAGTYDGEGLVEAQPFHLDCVGEALFWHKDMGVVAGRAPHGMTKQKGGE